MAIQAGDSVVVRVLSADLRANCVKLGATLAVSHVVSVPWRGRVVECVRIIGLPGRYPLSLFRKKVWRAPAVKRYPIYAQIGSVWM